MKCNACRHPGVALVKKLGLQDNEWLCTYCQTVVTKSRVTNRDEVLTGGSEMIERKWGVK